MRVARVTAGLSLLSCIACVTVVSGREPIDFARNVQPILQAHCSKCHGGVRREGGLSLVAGKAPAPGDSGQPLIVAGKPDESELVRRVTTASQDERMPAEGPPLEASQIDVLRRWIEGGGQWPAHWSFAPLASASLPAVEDATWPRTAIDAFVHKRLRTAKIDPSPEADRYTLVRRLSLDLLGLPPTPEEADAFCSDQRPDAYERLVDRLLASPHFGERWGRHWLDLARYADSDGYEVDKARPDAYRWRDWVIAAVNRDLPLDQFTVEQFAGDLLPEATPEQRLATAYHRQTLTNNEGGVDQEEYRLKAVLDRVSNTGTVWLGLTLGCAQCHDHPYDPFTQREFYSLAAIFNNADESEIELPGDAAPGAKPRRFRVLVERPERRTTQLLKRGEFLQPGDEVRTGVLRGLHPPAAGNEENSVSRLDLAHWLVDPANPLTPRVMANQIWLRMFGQGLVRTPEDFGARGEAPTYPELLDWLARELASRDWSRKALLRRIANSAVYRQSSQQRSELAVSDPHNRLLARQNRLRAQAEIVRDLQLAAGGLLSVKIGGPSVYPPLDAQFEKITFRSQLAWSTSRGDDRYRRGMYTFFKRSVPYPDLVIFDCPDASIAVAQRQASNTPLQALTILNSQTSWDAARGLARRMLAADHGDDRSRVRVAFRTCLTRPPSESETARLTELLRSHRVWYEGHPEDAQPIAGETDWIGVSNAEAAALTASANVIMNLDEFITRE
jgi:hypothetical protein